MTRWSPDAIAETWIYSTLHGNSTITSGVNGVFSREAKQGTLPPYIVFVEKITPSVQTMGQTIVWWNCHYNIDLVIGNDDIITPDPISVTIQDLLHGGSGVVTGGKVIASTIETMDQYQSIEAGIEYRHLVQMYEILVQQNDS